MAESKEHIFLSYAGEDRDRIEVIARTLEADGWPVWWDRENLPAGQRFHQVIDDAIQRAGCVLVFWSQHSVDSDWVIDEASEGKQLGKLLPVSLDDNRPPYGFRGYHYVDLTSWDGDSSEDAYRKLIRDIGTWMPMPEPKWTDESTPPPPPLRHPAS